VSYGSIEPYLIAIGESVLGEREALVYGETLPAMHSRET
jgi:hypothetical protein